MRNTGKDSSPGIKPQHEDRGNREQRIATLEQQMQLVQYTVRTLLSLLSNYTQLTQQVDTMEYRVLGMLRAIEKQYVGFSEAVTAEAEQVRIEVFEEMSKADDEKRSLRAVDDTLIQEGDSIIVATCMADGSEGGIFRAKLDLSDAELAPHKASLLGLGVNSKVTLNLDGRDHIVTILGIRRP